MVHCIGRLQFPYSDALLQLVCDGAVTVVKTEEQKLNRLAIQKHFNETDQHKKKQNITIKNQIKVTKCTTFKVVLISSIKIKAYYHKLFILSRGGIHRPPKESSK